MPILSIIAQPSANSLFAAYRPVILLVQATATNGSAKPPVVYCDIYFGGIYYKSLSKTMYNTLNATNSEWRFDIQDAAQEYLKKYLAENGSSSIAEALPILTKAMCKFRSSGYDASGFIFPEGIVPVQGTGTKTPVAGSGTASNEFFIINSTLQHQDNQSMADHLSAYKSGTWNANCYPLSHRPNGYKMTVNDSDFFPALIDPALCVASLSLNYKFFGQQTTRTKLVTLAVPCEATISSITVTQIGGTQNATASWPISAGATGYLYRVDSGVWVSTSQNSVTINNFTLGNHTIEVKATCLCSEGAPLSKSFTIENPSSFVCASVIQDLTALQTGEGMAGSDWTATDSPTSYRYRVDSGQWVAVTIVPISISNLSVGDHILEVQPICGNGVAGTSSSVNFTIKALPTITKINETSTGPGGIRTQYFQIGPNVSVGNKFTMSVYSHIVEVVAIAGDTPTSIATKLKNAINSTTATQWNDAGSAPAVGTAGFPPTATSSGDKLTVQLNYQNSFSYSATV